MKTLELKLPAPVLLVWGLPEDARAFPDVDAFKNLHKDNWQLIGKLSELTEQGARLLVHIPEQGNYRCYKLFRGQFHNVEETALESLQSSVEAKGYFVTNDLSDPELTMKQGNGNVYYSASEQDFQEYADREDKTLPANTLIFKRV